MGEVGQRYQAIRRSFSEELLHFLNNRYYCLGSR
jgi:hypothetical protein